MENAPRGMTARGMRTLKTTDVAHGRALRGRGGVLALLFVALIYLPLSTGTGSARAGLGRASEMQRYRFPLEAALVLTPLPPGPIVVGANVCAKDAGYVPPGVGHIAGEISWGDGASTHLRSRRERACHEYTKAGRMRVRLRLTGRQRASAGRKAKKMSAHTSQVMEVRARKHLVLNVAPGLEMLDLNEFGEPYPTQGRVFTPVLSGDGNHVLWGYNTSGLTKYVETGLVWRNLVSGETLEEPNLVAYGLDISGNGEYVVYATPSKVASNGYVEAMAVTLWNTRTGKRDIIDRKNPKATKDDGSTTEPEISENGQYVVFSSTSPALAPAGENLCTPFVSHGTCNETAGYIYLYNRHSRSLTPVPRQAAFGSDPALSGPVISADGEVVAFHSGYEVEVWNTRTEMVQSVHLSQFPCETDEPSLALSGDGHVLAETCMGDVAVIRLGETAETDQLEWMYTFPTPSIYPEPRVALDTNGSVLALHGTTGPSEWGQWPIYRVELPAGSVELLPAPGAIQGLKAEPKADEGMSEETVSISANGEEIAAVACTIQLPSTSENTQTCPQRSDVFRWDAPGS